MFCIEGTVSIMDSIYMTKKDAIKIFENQTVRTVWDSEQEKWYFSIVNIIAVLTESIDSKAYWRKLKQRLKEEGNETVTNCHSLKMIAADGKMRISDVADTEQLFRQCPLISINNYKMINPLITHRLKA